jgi:surface carbohydrate biosynthesis protein
MRIALIVDNPYRDLPGLVLLARSLCLRGATCFLVPFNRREMDVWPLAPDYLLMNHLRSVTQDLARRAMDAGIKVGVLDTEAGVLTSADAFGDTMAPDASVRHRISDFLSWGGRLAEHVVQKEWYLREQVAVTGHPRFDYYVDPWRQAALRLASEAEDCPAPMVLFNANFTLANPQFKTPEGEIRMLVERFGYDEAQVREWHDIQRQSLAQITALANRLAALFPQATFVVRPHPFEKLETYHGLLDRRGNLYAIKKGTVDGWILRSSAVIQRSCSTAVEAGLAGVPTFSPVWIPVALCQPTAEAVSVPCEGEEILVERLRAVLEGRYTIPTDVRATLDEAIRDWFYRMDGRSHERVAERIVASVRNGEGGVNLRRCRQVVYGRGRKDAPLQSRVASRVREALGVSVHWSFRRWRHEVPHVDWGSSEKYYDADQVRVIVDAIEACDTAHRGRANQRVRVQSAAERGEYHFGHRQGRSVAIYLA